MILLIIGKGGESQNSLVSYLKRAHIVVSGVEDSSVLKTFFLRLRKRGLLKTCNQYLFTLLVKVQGLYQNKTVPDKGVEEVRLSSLNSIQLFNLIERVNPDYVVLAGSSILKFKYVPYGFKNKILNIHLGVTPAFRGVYGGFWSIYSNRRDLFGVTLHFVDEGIDTGKIIAQSVISPESLINVNRQNRQLYREGYVLLDRFLCTGVITEEKRVKIPDKLWFHPTLLDYFKYLIVILRK